jgi:hypothetical protein
MTDQPGTPPVNNIGKLSEEGDLASRAKRQANEDLVVRAAAGARMLEKQRQSVRQMARLRRVTIATLAAVAIVAAAVWLRGSKETPSQARAAPLLVVGAVLQTELVTQTHINRTALVSLGDQGSFSVDLYFFDQNRFLKNKVGLTNQGVLRDALASIQHDLTGKWIVILAGASFEGDADSNLNLTRRRVAATVSMLKQFQGAGKSRFWQLPVGEYRAIRNGQELDETQEDTEARVTGRKNLPKQRQLVLIAIEANPVRTGVEAQSTVAAVIAELRKAGLVPTNYDHGASSPAPL